MKQLSTMKSLFCTMLAVAAATFAACVDDNVDEQAPSLELSETTIAFSGTATEDATVTVKSNRQWSIAYEDDQTREWMYFKVTGNEVSPGVYFGDGTLTDFTLEVEIKLEGRTGTSTAGIVFRAGNYAASPYDSYTSMQGYYLAINNNQIVLESLNYADGTQSVGTFVQGNPFAQSDVFIPVKIQVRGNNIKVWSGDTLMIDATDPFGFVNGKIGLYTNGAAAGYRNLKIYE